MRFIVIHKQGPRHTSGEVDQREIAEMSAFVQESIRQGIVKNGAGLLPKAPRTRVTLRQGAATVQHGVRGANNLLAGFALFKVADRDEAVHWARRFGEVVQDGELELGLVTEPWDLGFAPRPEGKVPERYLSLFMANEASESGAPPTEREQREMGALMGELISAGVLEFTEGILPSRLGTRLAFKAGKRVAAVDGPFAESKELIGGFCIVEVPTKEAALAWADRYGSILKDLEVDVLALHDEAAFDGTKR
jgi:hypothetical protein